MNRREFLQKTIASALVLSLPFSVDATITIVDIEFLDSFKDHLVMSGPHFDDNGQVYMNISFSENEIWKHIRLADNDGWQWYTDDKGRTWHSGLLKFDISEVEVDGEQSK